MVQDEIFAALATGGRGEELVSPPVEEENRSDSLPPRAAPLA